MKMTPGQANSIVIKALRENYQITALVEVFLAACIAEASELEPSPCQKPGHRRCDWVDDSHIEHESTSAGEMRTLIDEGHCLACQREEAIAAAERERCIGVCRSVKNGEWSKSSLCIEDTIAKVIRSLGKEPEK